MKAKTRMMTLVAVFVVAALGVVVTRCGDESLLDVGSEETVDPDDPDENPGGHVVETKSAVSFSNDAEETTDSAIDMIKAAAGAAKHLVIKLQSGSEPVSFGSEDLDTTGLVLKYTEGNTQSSTSPASVVIEGAGRTVDLTGTASGGSLITVGNGVTLTLKNITLKGLNEAEGGNTAALIKVTSGGKLILGNGAVIRDNYNNDSSNYGGGVYVDGSGTFTMEGGEISGNTVTQRGGGVYVLDSGAFTMKNGEISGNNALRGGGVCVTDTGAFTMEGGKISGNNANDYGGGVYADQEGTSFTMEGGEINGNTVNVYNGGGVYVEAKGTFTMKNGEIRGNSSGTQSYGGGVCVGSNGKFTKNGGGTIDDTNLAKHGKVAYMFLYAGKKRDVAAGPEDDLDSNKSGDAGGWDAWY